MTLICMPSCSDIRIDGGSVGPGPLFKRELDAGAHAIMLYQGALVAKRLTIDVPAGGHTTRRIVMPPLAAPASASTAFVPTPSASPSSEPPADDPQPPVAPSPAETGGDAPPPPAEAPPDIAAPPTRL